MEIKKTKRHTLHGEIAPNAHAASASKSPEPAHHLVPASFAAFQPALRPPLVRVREHVRVAMQAVRAGADAHAARERGRVGQGCRRGRSDARLGPRDGGMQSERFHQGGVQQGQRVQSAWRREGRRAGGGVMEGRREGETFGAKSGLQGRALGELVHVVGQCYTACFVAGAALVEEFGCDRDLVLLGGSRG